ncbi:MAG: ankyrin repeat domain-containing protein [Chloroflexota bacterium]
MSISFFDAIKQGNRYEVERQLIVDPSLIHLRENGLSPILIAAYHHEPEIASFLADKTITLTIFEASATGKINHVIRLLARDPELVYAYAEDGFQALGLACFFGQYDTAEYLVKAGAPVNSSAQNELKAAPIHSASAAGHQKILQMLLEHGADPNVPEQGGFTPLHAAAQNGNVGIIRTLLLGGADLTIKSEDGNTAMDIAMDAGYEKATVLLGEGVTRRFRPKPE